MQSSSKEREELERSAWAWVEAMQNPDVDVISEDNLRHAYRLRFNQHHSPVWKCKKNCRSNPNCHCSLGESQWLEDSTSYIHKASKNGDKNGDEEDEEEEDDDDMSLEKRLAGMPVGLKNLGNTCYVNSFLQIWFHNVPFREALYQWDAAKDESEADNETTCQAEEYRPKGKVASLQALFAMLEFTNRRAVDPNDFIAKLGLDPQVQQDAAEFSKLFMSLLESSLSNQDNDQVRSIVQNQFRGEYAYVTKCCKCQNESETPSFFYELDLALQGQKTLLGCLEDFLKEEKLEGDNQYYCSSCQSKQDATRCVRLSQLPPVLNLQLNRFIFDMQTGRKKKLNSLVHFPEVLEMSHFLRQDKTESNTYYLTGVLMHVGAEASHGHYIAHILESATGQWFKFSDAHVEKLLGRHSRLGSEIDPLLEGKKQRTSNGGSGTPKNKYAKGMQSSTNAYMLVYTSASALNSIRSPHSNHESGDKKVAKLRTTQNSHPSFEHLPIYLQAMIEKDRRSLEDDLQEQKRQRLSKHKEQVSLKTKMRSIYEKLPASGKHFEFLPMDWLVRFFTNPNARVAINISSSMCVHGKLDLMKIQDVKAVHWEVAEQLYQEHKDLEETKRLKQDSLCEPCVRNRCRVMKLAQSMSEDHKAITELLKKAVEKDDQSFWIGKNTLKKWRALAREDLDDRIKEEDAKYCENPPENGHFRDFFNADLMCECDNRQLCIQEGRRKLVSLEVWKILKTYFPKARDFGSSAQVCQHCAALDDKAKMSIEKRKDVANMQKNALSDIFNERSRPSWSKANMNKVYLVPRSFIDEWKSFIRNPQLINQVEVVTNDLLTCDHGGLKYPLDLDTESDFESFVYMVSVDEWKFIKDNFSVDLDISASRNKTDDCDFLLSFEPPVCDECVANLRKVEEEEQLKYRNVTIYVRRLTSAEKDPSDPDFHYVNGVSSPGSKRFKMNNGGHCIMPMTANGHCSDFVRRSNRRQKVRGEREFIVSSDMKLKDLKVKIMEAFKVAPFDQNLFINGQKLKDSDLTLRELRVLPKSLIYLRADEPNPGAAAIEPDDAWTLQHPEEGFKGTGLLEGS